MAPATDRQLIGAVHVAAKRLGAATTWMGTKKAMSVADDFLYELYILFRLVEDLQQHYSVVYVPGNGRYKNMFPQKPGRKSSGWAKFEIHDKNTGALLWQLCAGTSIRDISNVARTPDISIQDANASDDPAASDVKLIYDGKYKKSGSSRITHPEFSQFAHFVDTLQLRGASVPSITFARLTDLLANCLITNGTASTEPDAERNRVAIAEVESFYPGKAHQRHP